MCQLYYNQLSVKNQWYDKKRTNEWSAFIVKKSALKLEHQHISIIFKADRVQICESDHTFLKKARI
jgi:hypothetical protein